MRLVIERATRSSEQGSTDLDVSHATVRCSKCVDLGEARYSRMSTWDDSYLRVGSLVVDQVVAARPAARQDPPTERVSGYRLRASLRKPLRLALGGIPRGRGCIFIWLIVVTRWLSLLARVYNMLYLRSLA